MPIINFMNIASIDYPTYRIFENIVSTEKRKKANQFRYFNDAKQCVFAEVLLRYSLYDKYGVLEEPNIRYNEFGKAFVDNIENFSYNLSHSGKWVILAYGNTDVGVDIEKIQIEIEEICDTFFTREEMDYINEAIDYEFAIRLTQIWTLKESYVKYLGTGLSTELNSFSVNAQEGVVRYKENEYKKDLKLKSFLFDNDYCLSVCSTDKEVFIREIILKNLLHYLAEYISFNAIS